jgi:hypothetical protein
VLVHVLKIVALPHAAHAGRRDPALPQLIRAQLAEGGLIDGKCNDGILDLLWHAILQDGFLRLIPM